MTAEERKREETEPPTDATTQREPTLKWDDSKMQTAYSNAVNVTSTREEVSLFFGTNQTWNVGVDNQVNVQLSDRIVLNPYAAKRLSLLLAGVLKEYETRFGSLLITRD
jgi:Protein of unknown function (DUF3467)